VPYRSVSDGVARTVLLSIAVFVTAATTVVVLAPGRTQGPLIIAVLLSLVAVVIRWLGTGHLRTSSPRNRDGHPEIGLHQDWARSEIRPDDNDLIVAQAALGIAEFERLLAQTRRGAGPRSD
jgi:hypothetical protein